MDTLDQMKQMKRCEDLIAKGRKRNAECKKYHEKAQRLNPYMLWKTHKCIKEVDTIIEEIDDCTNKMKN